MRPFFVSLAEVFRLLCPYLRLGLNTVTYRQQFSLAAGITTASDAWGQIRLTLHDVLPGMSAQRGAEGGGGGFWVHALYLILFFFQLYL